MNKHIRENGYVPLWPVIEEYVTDPGMEPDPSKWLTKVVYRVVEENSVQQNDEGEEE